MIKDAEKTAVQEFDFAQGAREIMKGDSTVQVKLVRIGRKSRGRCITSPRDVFEFWRQIVSRRPWFDEDSECSIALLLDVKNNLKAWNLVGVGTGESCLMDARNVFRCAVASSARSVILAHNHPSGCCKPSKKDVELTRLLALMGRFLGIEVLDHLVIGDREFCSLREDHHEAFERKNCGGG